MCPDQGLTNHNRKKTWLKVQDPASAPGTSSALSKPGPGESGLDGGPDRRGKLGGPGTVLTLDKD